MVSISQETFLQTKRDGTILPYGYVCEPIDLVVKGWSVELHLPFLSFLHHRNYSPITFHFKSFLLTKMIHPELCNKHNIRNMGLFLVKYCRKQLINNCFN